MILHNMKSPISVKYRWKIPVYAKVSIKIKVNSIHVQLSAVNIFVRNQFIKFISLLSLLKILLYRSHVILLN